MTVIPFPQPFSDNTDQATDADNDSVLVLKELIYNLQREQTKIQDLLSSLGFALRSFSNLNQFLELTPLMAARVTDALGGALILYEDGMPLNLEQFHCQDSDQARQLGRS